MFFNSLIRKSSISRNHFYKTYVYHALTMSNDLRITMIILFLIVERWILFMLTSWDFFLTSTTTFVIYAFDWTIKLSVHILIISRAKRMRKFSSFLRTFLIKTNTKTTNVFEFALTTTRNILKKFFKFDERIATSKRSSLQQKILKWTIALNVSIKRLCERLTLY